MIDFIKRYQNNRMITNLNIVVLSFVLALWINFFVIDWTSFWKSLKASVLNSQTEVVIKADVYLENDSDWLSLVTWKNISDLNNISVSFTYNPDNLEITEISSDIWEIVNIANNPWINSIILTTNQIKNIKSWEKLLSLKINKKESVSENINVINANFSDTNWQTYSLSTSGLTF